MKKIWSYLTFFFLGGLIFAALAIKYLTGNTVEINIYKIKNKRVRGNIDTSVPIVIETPEKRKKKRKGGQ